MLTFSDNIIVYRYFRIPADTRDLNYGKYFSEGASGLSSIGEYNSDNTHQLTLEETKELLLRLEFIRQDIMEHR